jgi:FKBP-type peptidyl-prolyl cis-trans isomerase
MKYTLAIAALASTTQAIKQKTAGSPDAYGPNGQGYANSDASYDLSRIGIDITQPGEGKDCKVGDWTTLHWTATLMDGRVVSDSRAELGGLPKTFALGAHEVFSCWDLAVPKLKQGANARLTCPSYYAWGGARTWAPVGGEPIPLHSDVYFDVEVVECNRTPEFTEYYKQPVTTTMQPNRCMWLHLQEADATGNDMVLPEQEGHAIVHNKQRGDASQQWVWNDKQALVNVGSGAQLTDASGDATVSAAGAVWWYDSENQTLTKKVAAYSEERNQWVMNKYLSVPKESLMPGSEVDVLMARAAMDTNKTWRIEYCDSQPSRV